MSTTNSNRRRTYGGLAPGEADFTITLAKGVSDPSKIVSIDGDGMEDFLKRFRRCLMKSTKDHHANICYLDDSDSNYYSDGSKADLTGSEGDVMVYFPEFWYKGKSDSSSHKIHISTSPINGYHHAPASLVGAYKAVADTSNSKLYSRSNVGRSVNIAMSRFYWYSRNRGKGFHVIDYMQHKTIAWMLYTRYKNTDSQAMCGTGSGVYSGINNGVTNKLGVTDTTPSTANANVSNMLVNFLGIEGCWGYTEEFMEGIHIYSNDGNKTAVIVYDKPDLYNDSNSHTEYDSEYSYLESTFNLPTLRKLHTYGMDVSGYIGDIWGGEYGDTIIKENTGGQEYVRYYCDYSSIGLRYTGVFRRSYSSANTYGGILYLNGGSSNSASGGSSYGSRLAFDGTIVETSVTDFKAITDWRK